MLRSALSLVMFLLASFFLRPAEAWNPDYAYDLPKQRRMCVRREGKGLSFYSITSEEDCPAPFKRYIVIFGREPRGAIALLPSTTSQKFYPPFTLRWPSQKYMSRNPLWHFTCVKIIEKEVLGSKLQLYQYRGEWTTDGKKDCLAAEERALQYCQTTLKGEVLLETCPISWGS